MERWHALWATRAALLRLLGLLTAVEVTQVMRVDMTCRRCVRRELKRFRRGSARLGLALWCEQHITLAFESFYQEIETHQIARSAVGDPRVPPRVVSTWAERGPVPGGVVALRPELLPNRTERGVALRFVAAAEQRPMLTSVVQHQRRIYTVVTLLLAVPARSETMVLRRLVYLKEYGEWRAAVLAADKRRLDDHGALCRYDLVSLDGSVALELEVPRGADSMMDYYLVKRATVMLPLEELLHPFVKKLRPQAALSFATADRVVTRPCRIVLSFGRLDGTIEATHRIHAELTVEQQVSQSPSSSPAATETNATDHDATNPPDDIPQAPRARTGIETLDIATITRRPDATPTTLDLPEHPGYLWISLEDPAAIPSASSLYYTTAVLHNGATRSRGTRVLDAPWVPGTLESFPTPQSRQRRPLKGYVHVVVDLDSSHVRELSIVAQHLPLARLEPYAASIESYTRP